MKKEEIRETVKEDIHDTVKEVLETLDKEKVCGGVLCFWDVAGEVNAAAVIRKPEGEDKLTTYSRILVTAALNDKYYMKAMVTAGLLAEIEYTKDEAKRKLIREKAFELADLFDA